MSLEVKDLTRRLVTASEARQGETIFEDLSFVVKPGERLFIVGPSGAGKSLLLRSLAALDEPQVRWRRFGETATIRRTRERGVYRVERGPGLALGAGPSGPPVDAPPIPGHLSHLHPHIVP